MYIIVRKDNGEVVCEVFNEDTLHSMNAKVYEAIPTKEYLEQLNKKLQMQVNEALSGIGATKGRVEVTVGAFELQTILNQNKPLSREMVCHLAVQSGFKLKGKFPNIDLHEYVYEFADKIQEAFNNQQESYDELD